LLFERGGSGNIAFILEFIIALQAVADIASLVGLAGKAFQPSLAVRAFGKMVG